MLLPVHDHFTHQIAHLSDLTTHHEQNQTPQIPVNLDVVVIEIDEYRLLLSCWLHSGSVRVS